MFDPTIGQWLSEDPIGFEAGDENLRRYVGNGPVNATDPSGLELKFGPGFTPDQEKAIEDAWDRGRAAAFEAGSDIAGLFDDQLGIQVRNSTYRRLRQFFETPTEKRPNTAYMQLGTATLSLQEAAVIGGVFSTTAIGMDQRDVYVYCDTTTTGASAYVKPIAFGYYKVGVFITPVFWGKTPREQAGIMFHEATHYFANTVDIDYIGVSPSPNSPPTQVPIYEDTDHLSAEQAIRNASTYEHYLLRYYLK